MLKRKLSTIVIKKKEILNKVETLAYKRVESSLNDSAPETQSALQADSVESMDSIVLYSLLDSRDSEVRSKLLYCLVPEDSRDMVVSNEPTLDDEYVYKVQVPESFTRDQLVTACALINDYFIYATLHDWYIQHGAASTVDYNWLSSLLRKIASAFRFDSITKPLQPFGPAEPFGINKNIF